MSTDPSAMVFFGFCFFDPNEEVEEEDDEELDEDDPELTGLEDPEEREAPEPLDDYARAKGWDGKDYAERLRIAEASGIEEVITGYDGSICHWLVIASTHTNVDWTSTPLDITTLDPTKVKEWTEQLREFCKVAGLPFQTPDFHLASLYI